MLYCKRTTADKTWQALEKLVNGKIKEDQAQPKNVPTNQDKTSFIWYTLGSRTVRQGYNSGSDVVEDPLELPRFKHKKIPKAQVEAMHKAAPAALFKGGNVSVTALVGLSSAKTTSLVSFATREADGIFNGEEWERQKDMDKFMPQLSAIRSSLYILEKIVHVKS